MALVSEWIAAAAGLKHDKFYKPAAGEKIWN